MRDRTPTTLLVQRSTRPYEPRSGDLVARETKNKHVRDEESAHEDEDTLESTSPPSTPSSSRNPSAWKRAPRLTKDERSEPTWVHRLHQRQKQVDYGKNTNGYDNYVAHVPRSERKRGDPRTPDLYLNISKRCWDGLVRKWRRELHRWDNVDEAVQERKDRLKNGSVRRHVLSSDTTRPHDDSPSSSHEDSVDDYPIAKRPPLTSCRGPSFADVAAGRATSDSVSESSDSSYAEYLDMINSSTTSVLTSTGSRVVVHSEGRTEIPSPGNQQSPNEVEEQDEDNDEKPFTMSRQDHIAWELLPDSLDDLIQDLHSLDERQQSLLAEPEDSIDGIHNALSSTCVLDLSFSSEVSSAVESRSTAVFAWGRPRK